MTTVEEMKAAERAAARALLLAPYKQVSLDALSVDQRFVTPAEARTVLTACEFERQRNLSLQHVERLGEEMKKGWFLSGTPIWICVLPDKSMRLVNGNHTMAAIVESGVTVPLTIVYQQVKSLEEAGAVYACFDIQRVRSFLNAAQAAGAGETVANLGAVLAGVGGILRDFRFNTTDTGWERSSRRLRIDGLKEYEQAAQLLAGYQHGAPTVNLYPVRRAPIMAVALATTKYQPSTAEKFWGGMVHDDGLKARDPRKALLRYLMNRQGAGGGVVQQHQCFAAANAWNAFFEGREVDHFKGATSLSFTLAGTPWDGKAGSSMPSRRASRLTGEVPHAAGKSRVGTGKRVDGRGEAHHEAVYVP